MGYQNQVAETLHTFSSLITYWAENSYCARQDCVTTFTYRSELVLHQVPTLQAPKSQVSEASCIL